MRFKRAIGVSASSLSTSNLIFGLVHGTMREWSDFFHTFVSRYGLSTSHIEDMKLTLLVLATSLSLGARSTQPQQLSPYAGQEARDIKAVAPSEVAGLLAGKGLGFAKSAELNGYPGPAHVLELSAKLDLSPQQLAETKAIFGRMEVAAKASGAELVQAERELEALFRSREITPESLSRAVQQVASHQTQVRNAHLLAHIEQTKLLSPAQVAQYSALRGYSGAHSHSEHQ
jgi:hypothetical protein